MKRIALNAEELALVERHRADRAIYNRAIADALSAASTIRPEGHEGTIQQVLRDIAALRKEN